MATVAGPVHPTRAGSRTKYAPPPPQQAHAHDTYVPTRPPVGLTIPDPYYGHEKTAKTCSRFITSLFSCPDTPPAPSAASTSSPPAPAPPLAQFVGYALHRTRLHSCVTYTALFLLQRLKTRFPAARGSSGHRLFISAFMIASKVVCDDTYSNKSWCVVGQGMFSLKEINQMEREMCGYLEWQLNVPPEELETFRKKVDSDYDRSGARIPLTVDTSSLYSTSSSRRGATGLQTPPISPRERLPATPDSSCSPTPSPASSDISTPPSALGADTASIVSSATSMDAHFPRGARAVSPRASKTLHAASASVHKTMW